MTIVTFLSLSETAIWLDDRERVWRHKALRGLPMTLAAILQTRSN